MCVSIQALCPRGGRPDVLLQPFCPLCAGSASAHPLMSVERDRVLNRFGLFRDLTRSKVTSRPPSVLVYNPFYLFMLRSDRKLDVDR